MRDMNFQLNKIPQVYRVFAHEPPYQTVVMCCNPVFTAVLCAWITVLFSMLEWGSLRLVPINNFFKSQVNVVGRFAEKIFCIAIFTKFNSLVHKMRREI